MNALSPELPDELIEAFVDAGTGRGHSLLISVGDQAFYAGAGLKARAGQDRAGKPFQMLLSRVQRRIFEVVPDTVKPTIGARNGAAIAGGGFRPSIPRRAACVVT
jgi:enoyl-CoA hydratase/carnithine racemase